MGRFKLSNTLIFPFPEMFDTAIQWPALSICRIWTYWPKLHSTAALKCWGLWMYSTGWVRTSGHWFFSESSAMLSSFVDSQRLVPTNSSLSPLTWSKKKVDVTHMHCCESVSSPLHIHIPQLYSSYAFGFWHVIRAVTSTKKQGHFKYKNHPANKNMLKIVCRDIGTIFCRDNNGVVHTSKT